MNNTDVKDQLDSCERELDQINTRVRTLGPTNDIVPYLSKYGLIRACGAIEQAFKAIIADRCSHRANPQIQRYVSRKVRDGSANPSLDQIYKILNEFDPNWKTSLKQKIQAHPHSRGIRDSVQSLVDTRNELAHGGSPGVSIGDVKRYFSDARLMIDELDSIVSL